jgi:mannose-6-phosphate isomerase-like protein (cupin superfamily)
VRKTLPGAITLTTVNDAVVRLEIFKGDVPWHKHTDQQEFFFVLEGEIVLDIEGREPGGVVVVAANLFTNRQLRNVLV